MKKIKYKNLIIFIFFLNNIIIFLPKQLKSPFKTILELLISYHSAKFVTMGSKYSNKTKSSGIILI